MPKQMIFLGGLQRSGTTIFGRLLATHPDISGLIGTPTREDEGQFVQDVYLDDHQMGAVHGRSKGQAIRWAYHREAHLTETETLLRDRPAERLLNAWLPYSEDPNAPVMIEKSPSNLTRTRFLQAAFPDARFVILARHPILQGLAVRKWAPGRFKMGFSFDKIVDHWLTAMELYSEDSNYLRKHILIDYGTFLRHPSTVLADVVQFLDLESFEFDTSGLVDADHRYIAYWNWMTRGVGHYSMLSPPGSLAGRLSRTIERISARAIGSKLLHKLEKKYERRIRVYGYSFRDFS